MWIHQSYALTISEFARYVYLAMYKFKNGPVGYDHNGAMDAMTISVEVFLEYS
jgi:hypothetical protein